MTELCPKCSTPVWRESVDLGVGIYYGPYGCPECGWSEWKEYDLSNGESPAQLENPNHHVDQWGGLHPNVNKNLSGRKPMKLYCMKITYSAYVLAEDENMVQDFDSEIRRYEEPNFEIYETVTNGLGWESDCLVYHSGNNDITLRKALDIVNNKQEKN
jgi:hypothetical protein